MNRQQRPSGPRCVVCGRVYQPRVLRDGTMSQTCGQTACVTTLNRRKSANPGNNNRVPKFKDAKNPSLV